MVGEYICWGERLEQPKLPHHTVWHMELHSPVTNQWATHQPEVLLRRASRVQFIVFVIAETIPAPIRLPHNLQMSQETISILISE